MKFEEIMQSLRFCNKQECSECGFHDRDDCIDALCAAAAATIELLLGEGNCLRGVLKSKRMVISRMQNELAEAKAERAVLLEYAATKHECQMCEHDSYCPAGVREGDACRSRPECDGFPRRKCGDRTLWKWRGLPTSPEKKG